jgi:hypothetical protein
MNYILFFSICSIAIAIGDPVRAQFSSFSSGSDNCSSVCVKLDLGSANNDSSSFNGGFNSGSPTSGNNVRWQLGLTWRPNPPEVAQGEADRTKQRLDDNRTLMLTLAEAIAQNKTELARGIAILLAPRLGYKDPRILLTEMKEGSMNIGSTKVEVKPLFNNSTNNNSISQPIDPKNQIPNTETTPVIELK